MLSVLEVAFSNQDFEQNFTKYLQFCTFSPPSTLPKFKKGFDKTETIFIYGKLLFEGNY
jgi:hypothetical protein